jgi:hypothetical protein
MCEGISWLRILSVLRPRNIRVHKILALEQQLGAVRFGAGVGQAIAEIQAGVVFAAFTVALEGGDGAVGDVLLGLNTQTAMATPGFRCFLITAILQIIRSAPCCR